MVWIVLMHKSMLLKKTELQFFLLLQMFFQNTLQCSCIQVFFFFFIFISCLLTQTLPFPLSSFPGKQPFKEAFPHHTKGVLHTLLSAYTLFLLPMCDHVEHLIIRLNDLNCYGIQNLCFQPFDCFWFLYISVFTKLCAVVMCYFDFLIY